MFPFNITTIAEVQYWQACWMMLFACFTIIGIAVLILVTRGKLKLGVAKPLILVGAIGFTPGITIGIIYSVLVSAQWLGGPATLVNYLFYLCICSLPAIAVSIPLVLLTGIVVAFCHKSVRPLLHALVLAFISGVLCYWVNDVLIYHFKTEGKTFTTSPSGYGYWLKE